MTLKILGKRVKKLVESVTLMVGIVLAIWFMASFVNINKHNTDLDGLGHTRIAEWNIFTMWIDDWNNK